jgi:hypothetical protein
MAACFFDLSYSGLTGVSRISRKLDSPTTPGNDGYVFLHMTALLNFSEAERREGDD